MNKPLALVCLLLGLGFYGLLVAWIVNLSSVDGLSQVPHVIHALGWEAYVYGTGLVTLGTTFLLGGAALAGHRR